MSEQEIIDNNILIAKFIGRRGKINKNLYWVNVPSIKWVSDKEMKFHSSWDWLIPVINKIYDSDWYYKWKETFGQFKKEIFINTEFIKETWKDVVEFIKWYNLQKIIN